MTVTRGGAAWTCFPPLDLLPCDNRPSQRIMAFEEATFVPILRGCKLSAARWTTESFIHCLWVYGSSSCNESWLVFASFPLQSTSLFITKFFLESSAHFKRHSLDPFSVLHFSRSIYWQGSCFAPSKRVEFFRQASTHKFHPFCMVKNRTPVKGWLLLPPGSLNPGSETDRSQVHKSNMGWASNRWESRLKKRVHIYMI